MPETAPEPAPKSAPNPAPKPAPRPVATPVLVTGATGYVGGRLVPALLERGHTVRAVGRSAAKIRCRPWGGHARLEIAEADIMDREALTRAAQGCGAAYYLVHSMNPRHGDFAAADRRAARSMVQAAKTAGLERIIYLGGLGEEQPGLSKHLASRAEVAEILALAPCPLTYLRAAMLLGSGSASFEILRYLSENLPVMITPRWVRTNSAPIAVSNVLAYLVGCLEHPETAGQTYDICGPDVLSYQDLFQLYAEVAGLRRRLILPVPVLSPWLSSLWITLVTPVPAPLARPLIDGLRNEAVCTEHRIREIIPQKLLTCRKAIKLALQKVRQMAVDTCWSDAGSPAPPEWIACGDAGYAGGYVLECAYACTLAGTPEQVWPAIAAVGGSGGWFGTDILWRMRGVMDKLMGGPGLSRGRRDPRHLRPYDALDFWRVAAVDEPRRLVLAAEMKAPGEAVLEFGLEPVRPGETRMNLRARFLPRGLLGLAYWYSVYPLHHLVFSRMLTGIARASGLALHEPPHRTTPVFRHACRIALGRKPDNPETPGRPPRPGAPDA